MIRRLTKIFLLIAFLAGAFSVNAQQTSSILKGRVLDEKEMPIAGVKVQIVYLPWNKTITAVTNKKGIFCVANLAPGGPYNVKFTMEGYRFQARENLSFIVNEINDLSLHMDVDRQVAQRSEAVGAPLVSIEDPKAKGADL
jgi:hypothetical protein